MAYATNSTKVYFNMELPEVVDMRQRCCRPTPPRQITLPTKRGNSTAALLLFDNRNTISNYWFPNGMPEQNKILYRVTANRLLTDDGWYYPGCSNCTMKLVGEEGSCCGSKSRTIPTQLIFVTLDGEVQNIAKHQYQRKSYPTFTVTKLSYNPVDHVFPAEPTRPPRSKKQETKVDLQEEQTNKNLRRENKADGSDEPT
ncbi:hypothetical protein C5167_049198 [Papaver somniferum]|uniref:Uncharacterized protein n=1 Tax=Papaver somniferum TaxID=3469 RepID=A0A4Y7KP48_PAPSO|nr:hypothetical protein C5167_049198 [Papaver somniferum]